MTTSLNRRYVPEIDQLRCLAALLVIFYHGFQLMGARLARGAAFDPGQDWVIARNPLIAVIEEGHSGVGLFIVLSGFVLSLGAVGRRLSYGRFLLARILRIYPVLVVFAVVAFAVRPTGVLNMVATLLPLNTTETVRNDFTAMFWAVGVEFECYLVFPFLILFSNRFGTRLLVQIIIIAVVLRMLAVFSEGANARDISYWTVAGRIDEFCIGMIAARLYLLHGWRDTVPRILVLPTGGLVLVMLWLFNRWGGWPVISTWKLIWPTVEGSVWALFLLCYLRAGQLLPRLVARPLTRVGEVSYSLYMVHFVVVNFCIANGLYVRATGNGYYDALLSTAVIVLPIGSLIAWLLYSAIERPFLQMRPRYVEGAIDADHAAMSLAGPD